MGKAKGKGSEKNAATKKCTCEHPYKCDCGNRPERPSKGHKWDPETQQWGGKGHKQKGASGQSRVVGEAAKTSEVGKTKVEQWQRLPSVLLQEYCQKQKRTLPKFKELMGHGNKFKCRCILPDAKNREKDLIFVPAEPVSNEEQAREEAALLALLELTPSLPHERKLPEPYKTTWLCALESLKEKQSGRHRGTKISGNDEGQSTSASDSAGSKATANTKLALGNKHVSLLDKRRDMEERRKDRNAKIRRHEAIRMANRDHPVFLSAKLRTLIQRLLRGETANYPGGNDVTDEESPDLSKFNSDQQQYVEERLHTEGFTRKQARHAYEELPVSHKNNEDENLWEDIYDECLQWLCVHLTEDQLPEGFDPRGSTLEVVGPLSKMSSTNPEAEELANKFGLLLPDALWLLSRVNSLNQPVDTVFRNRILELAGFDGSGEPNRESNGQTLTEEIESLEAMFPEGFDIERKDNITFISLPIPDDMKLSFEIDNSAYPFVPPSICVSGKWPKSGVGVGFHVQLVKFVSSLDLGAPMIFEIFAQVQLLLQTVDEVPDLSLTSSLPTNPPTPRGSDPVEIIGSKTITPKASESTTNRRPRARGAFWSIHPSKTPPATAFPKIGPSLEYQRKRLPAGQARKDFLSVLRAADEASRVVLVTGDTGCGKTTQIPQFILEESPDGAKIVVAQPRRLAATGVAARVAEERGESKPGLSSVGYVVRGDSAVCASTRLLFCTFGILLRQLQAEDALENITHIVIDEVHERNLDGDVLMALLKQSLAVYPNLRVVLMSATLDADRFAAYWGTSTPRMHIPGRTFPVQDFFLEDVLLLTGYNPPKKRGKKTWYGGNQRPQKRFSPWDISELSEEEDGDNSIEEASPSRSTEEKSLMLDNGVPLEEKVRRIDETNIDYDLLGRLVKHLIDENTVGKGGSILVFLPGAPEINQAKDIIGRITSGMSILLLPLHGGLQPKEQNAVFNDPPKGVVKVILSTNVAETSITIPDCTVVVDGCREKQSSYDPNSRMPLLIEVFASQASLKQRRGRAGRVQEGKCYKLISKNTYEKLHAHTAPEITRCALDQTLLSLLFLGVETGNGVFLQSLLDPPSPDAENAALDSLWKIGAVERIGPNQVFLTPLGMHLAGIPAPPMVGKMLIMGAILGCREAALAMAAGISTGRSPFLRIDNPRKSKEQESIEEQKNRMKLAERARLFEQAGNSDHAMLAAAYMSWRKLPTSGDERRKYCDKLGLAFNGMKDIHQLVKQYDSALRDSGYHSSQESDRNANSWRILRTCAVSAMAPGQLVRVQRPSTKYSSTAEGAMEKDGVAKELKFFVRIGGSDGTYQEERVFIHPSSALFSVGNFSCPWLVFNSMVKTSKPFLRDATECSAYSLLLFGGPLEVEARNNLIVVGGWAKLSANPRIGALIRGLRRKMDDLLSEKVKNPGADIADTPEMRLIVNLLMTDGMA